VAARAQIAKRVCRAEIGRVHAANSGDP